MRILMRPGAILTAALAVLLAFAFSSAAMAKPRKLKTPNSELGIKRELDGAPNIKVDNRAKHIAKPARKRSVAQ